MFPSSLVDDVLTRTGRVEQRTRLLPARVVVYFVLAMCLFSGQGYEEVARLLTEGLRERRRWRGAWTVPSTAAGLTVLVTASCTNRYTATDRSAGTGRREPDSVSSASRPASRAVSTSPGSWSRSGSGSRSGGSPRSTPSARSSWVNASRPVPAIVS